jgi:hypothetical protein
MTPKYLVEWETDDGQIETRDYDNSKSGAIAFARKKSRRTIVAYVIAYTPSDRIGSKSFGQGLHMETLGEGF